MGKRDSDGFEVGEHDRGGRGNSKSNAGRRGKPDAEAIKKKYPDWEGFEVGQHDRGGRGNSKSNSGD